VSTHPLFPLWSEFFNQFVQQVRAQQYSMLVDAWVSSNNRTRLYTERVLPRIAEELGYKSQPELFRVDLSFGTEVPVAGAAPIYVPVIQIESENVALGAGHEMRKLASLHAPLKVLISCGEWGSHWPKPIKERCLTEWQSILGAYHSVWPRVGLTGVIVAEFYDPERKFRFFGYLLDERGHALETGLEECFHEVSG
jgi:hypothetical protein